MHTFIKEFNRLPGDILARLKFIGGLADKLGFRAYAVGGFVRDLLMGVDNFDLDIVVEGNGIDFAKELSAAFGVGFIKHRQFMTATVKAADGIKIDIATARCEAYEHPASLPVVSPGTIKNDLGRRDFSINAMSMSISGKDFGELVDFFHGREDLKKKTVRVLHELSFIDDPTRILRAIRFEQRHGFRIEQRTAGMIKKARALKMLEKVQKHRLRDEIILILKEPFAYKCIKRIGQLYGFGFIHKNLRVDSKVSVSIKNAGRIYEWFRASFPHKRGIDLWVIYLALLLRNLKPRELGKLLKDFAFLKGESKRVLSFHAEAAGVIAKLKRAVRPSRIFGLLEPLSFEVILLIMLESADTRVNRKVLDFFSHYNETRICVGGQDLKEIGIDPGPRFKEILKLLLHAKLDKSLKTKKDELLYLRNRILPKG